MTMWLYQLSSGRDTEEPYLPSDFRHDIRESKKETWPYGRVKGEERPQKDDVVVFFYAPRGEKEPGIYGWAVVRACDDEIKEFDFMPKPPTKNLMRQPWWDENVKHIVDAIRGRFKQGTLWPVKDSKLVQKLRAGIRKRLSPSANDVRESLPAVSGSAVNDVPDGLPVKVKMIVERIIRDTKTCFRIKQLYGCRCQVCGVRLKLKPGVFYAEAHHLQPLGGEHKGPDLQENILCLCPNHHALFDYFAVPLDLGSLRWKKHEIRKSFVDYHNAQVTKADHPSR